MLLRVEPHHVDDQRPQCGVLHVFQLLDQLAQVVAVLALDVDEPLGGVERLVPVDVEIEQVGDGLRRADQFGGCLDRGGEVGELLMVAPLVLEVVNSARGLSSVAHPQTP